MDPNLFRESREKVEHFCEEIELQIKKKAVMKSAEKLEEAQRLLKELTKFVGGDIQKRSVNNLSLRIKNLSINVDEILSKREAGKKGDGNIAFKCNWNDNHYKAPCSEKAYEYNLIEGRAWCSSPFAKCREYGTDVNLENNPCYESIALKEMYFAAGWDHTGERVQPRHIHNAREGSMAILTTRSPGTEEVDRLIVGCLLIERVNDDPGQETKIYGDKERSIEVPFEEMKIKFWDFYKNPENEDIVLWASGLFRYITNATVLGILRAIGEKFTNTSRELHKVIDLIKYYEKLKNHQ